MEKKKGGRRPGAGRPALVRENNERAMQGLPPIYAPVKPPPSKAILPESKKAKTQMILAGMLNSKGKAVIQKILDKALDDDDGDQMACLKLVADRIIPQDYMNKAKGNNQIQINISGIGIDNIQTVENDYGNEGTPDEETETY